MLPIKLFPLDGICLYKELMNMFNRKPTRNEPNTTSSCKCHCLVRNYSLIYFIIYFIIFHHRLFMLSQHIIITYYHSIHFRKTDAIGFVTVTVNGQRYESLLRYDGNQLCNSIEIWIASFLYKRRSSAHWKSIEAVVEAEFSKLSVIISLQHGRSDRLILIRVISGCGVI